MADTFDQWCIVELMGRTIMAGKVTEQPIGGGVLIRVDVPATSTQEAFTKFFGISAIYAMTPTTEENVKLVAEGLRSKPVELWQLPGIRQLPDLGRSKIQFTGGNDVEKIEDPYDQ